MMMMTLDAKPGPVSIDAARTAVIVVDMQNDFGAEGGMFHRAGIDISGIQKAIGPTVEVLRAARRLGLRIIYLKMGYNSDLSDLGAPDAPNRERHLRIFGVGERFTAPSGEEGQVLIRDCWGTEIVEALAPEPGDLVVHKTRFSGFYRTELESVLNEAGITHLIVTGCTTSVCVESTIRDAFFRDYHCVLLGDCTSEPFAGKAVRSNHDASIELIEALFGWVSASDAFVAAVATAERIAQEVT